MIGPRSQGSRVVTRAAATRSSVMRLALRLFAWFDLSDLGQPHATALTVLGRSVVQEAEAVVRSER